MHTQTSWMRIAHGEISEQWIAGPSSPRPRGGPSDVLPVVEVVAHDTRAKAARDYAERQVRAGTARPTERVARHDQHRVGAA
jgi:hypothetical protein